MTAGLSMFASLGTLLCCALPALLVTLGAGAVLAGLVSTMPWLVTLSKYKLWVFLGAGLLLLLAGGMLWWARRLPCPVDPVQARLCTLWRRISQWLYGLSLGIYLTGGFFAFIAPILI